MVPDDNTHRPGIQGAVDMWRVDTSEGTFLMFALTGELAQRHVIHSITASGKSGAPTVQPARLATSDDVLAFYAKFGALLGIRPGTAIPVERLAEAARQFTPEQLALYRNLTERTTADVSPLVAPPEPHALRIPREFNIDMGRLVLFARSMVWFFGWLTVALLPLIAGIGYWFGVNAGWWPMVGAREGESMWEQRDVFILNLAAPVLTVTALWSLGWFVATLDAFYARFNMWPDRYGAGSFRRHQGVR